MLSQKKKQNKRKNADSPEPSKQSEVKATDAPEPKNQNNWLSSLTLEELNRNLTDCEGYIKEEEIKLNASHGSGLFMQVRHLRILAAFKEWQQVYEVEIKNRLEADSKNKKRFK